MAVTNNATILETHDGTAPTYTSIGGGQGAGTETNFFFRGVTASSRKMSGVTKNGFFFAPAAGSFNLSAAGTHVKVFINAITQAGFTDYWFRIGSSTTVYEEFNVTTAFYDNDAGGWIPHWVEVDAGTDTGSPDFTAVTDFAVICSMNSISGNVKNWVTDQAHSATRPVMTWDGTGGDLDDFITSEITDGFGALKLSNGLYTCFASLQIGSSTSTTFNAVGNTIAFPDATWLPAASTWMGLDFDLSHASTDLDWRAGAIISGNPSGATARKPDIIVTGTSGVVDFSGRAFDGMRALDFTTGVTANDCVITNSGSVGALGADLVGASILTPAVAANTSGLIWNVNTEPDGLLDDMTFTKTSGTAHHAIEFGTAIADAASFTLRGCAFGTDFSGTEDGSTGDETFHFLDTTGSITINLVNCSGNFGYRTEGVGVTIVADPVMATITVQDTASPPVVISSARVFLEASDGSGPLPFEDSVSIVQTGGTATVTHSAHGLETNNYVVIRGVAENEYNKVAQITVVDAGEYTYSVDSGAASPATGSPVSSGVIISGLTNGSGIIVDTRTYSADQPFKGWARKSSGSPFYQNGNLSGIIDATDGFAASISLASDE